MAELSLPRPDTPIERFQRFVRENPETAIIYGIMLVIIGIGALISPDFRTANNGFNVLRQAVALGLISTGQTFVILAGGIDLSAGATISLVSVYTAGFMAEADDRLGLVLLIIFLVCLLALFIGLINALIVNELRVPPFITTLGTGSVIQGFVLMYAKRPVGTAASGWEYFAEGMVGPVPFPVIFLLALVLAASFVLRRTALGRHIIATGGSDEIARLSGIRTKRVRIFSYMFCSFTAALTGLFLVSRLGVGDPQIGGLNYDRFDLDSIAAVLIGGTRLGGGKGTLAGTMAGVLILIVLNNIFNLIGVSTYYQWIIKGLIVLGAVAVYALRENKD